MIETAYIVQKAYNLKCVSFAYTTSAMYVPIGICLD